MHAQDQSYRWLNELSLKFMTLGAGYLLPEQTVDNRVNIVGETAERILKMPGLANRFIGYMKKGFYSLSTPIWTNFGTSRGLPISCVVGDTWINTKEGGGKQARDIVIGDMVLTHKGRYRKVATITPTKDRSDIYRLKVVGRMTDLHLTGDHLVLTNLGWIRADTLDPLVHLVAINDVVEFAENDQIIDMRQHVKWPTVEKEGRLFKAGSESVRQDRRVDVVSYCASPFADVSVDNKLAWAIGVWFAEGSVAKGADGDPNGIRITTNAKDETEMAEKWLAVMSDKFGVNGKSYDSSVERNGKTNSWRTSNLNSKAVGSLFDSFGNGCKKKLVPQWMIDAPKEILAAFLDGLLAGDGSKRKNGTCKITLANPKLILQVYQIGLKLGRTMSLQMQDRAGVLATTNHVYTILFRDSELSSRRSSSLAAVRFTDGLSYAPIRVIEKTNRVECVFDFGVEEDHSFSAAGVVLHNCFGTHIDDSMESILEAHAEVGMQTKLGGGTSIGIKNLRRRGAKVRDNGESSGSVHFLRLFETMIGVVSQGGVRRGNLAAYQWIDHPDAAEFLNCRTEGNPIQDLSFGICVPNYWMKAMIAGDAEKRKLWARVLEMRAHTGYPYIMFPDNANAGTVDVYKDKQMLIDDSNLCSEIFLPKNKKESFVCDLSSMNDLYYDEWHDTDAPEVLTYVLDAVMTEFIEKADGLAFMERPVRFAKRHRAIGIGQFGWHSYLQSKGIPFESMDAKYLNVRIAKTIQEKTYAASRKLAELYGEPELLKGYGRRNTTLNAIAPTKSSSFIIGQASEAIEPERSNYMIKDLAKGKYTIRNRYLTRLLEEKGQNNETTWSDILNKGGSVQHLDCLSEQEKAVFKTFAEISQREVVLQAAARQKYIDQGQSLNLMIHPSVPVKDVNALIIEGWQLGIKSYYYQMSVNAAQTFSRDILACTNCSA